MKKLIWVALAVGIVLVVIYLLARPRGSAKEWVEASGVIEATEVDVSALVAGRLATLLVKEGDPVKRGQVIAEIERQEFEAQLTSAGGALQAAEGELARVEASLVGAKLSAGNARTAYEKSTELKGRYEAGRAQYEAATAARDQAKARLELVRAGTRPEQLEQARAAAASAQAAWEDAQRELARLEKLLAEGAVSEQQVDRQRTAADTAAANHDAAQARLAEAEAGFRTEERRQAEAALAQAEANLAAGEWGLATAKELYGDRLELKQKLDLAEAEYRAAQQARAAAEGRVEAARGALAVAEKKLTDATVRAPITGVITLKIREAGEVVSPGQGIVRLADLDHMWLRVYVPETVIGRVKLGQQAEVTTDADPRQVHRGQVVEIAQEPEFTPKNVQTREQRAKLVFGVKIAVDNPARELKPGLPADARIRVGG